MRNQDYAQKITALQHRFYWVVNYLWILLFENEPKRGYHLLSMSNISLTNDIFHQMEKNGWIIYERNEM